MPKVKNKRVPRKKSPRPSTPVTAASSLDFDAIFEEVVAPVVDERKSKRSKGRRKTKGPEEMAKRDLINRIEKIYQDNNFHRESSLDDRSFEELKMHFNRLQWGLIEWITRKGILPDPPSEIPDRGFRCITAAHKVWTNPFFCELRTQYPPLYPACNECTKWRTI